MRLCANENIPGECVAALRAAGHDVLWIRESMPGASDEQVLSAARKGTRLLLTCDKDFGGLVFRLGKDAAAGIVLFRIDQPSGAAVADAVMRVLISRTDWEGHFSVVDDRTIRMRRLQ